jgi:hypothetical protein
MCFEGSIMTFVLNEYDILLGVKACSSGAVHKEVSIF